MEYQQDIGRRRVFRFVKEKDWNCNRWNLQKVLLRNDVVFIAVGDGREEDSIGFNS